MLTGRTVEAEEALRIGLVTEVVDTGRHVERALELAGQIAAFPQETMLSDRRALLEGAALPLDEGLALEARTGARAARRRAGRARSVSCHARATPES